MYLLKFKLFTTTNVLNQALFKFFNREANILNWQIVYYTLFLL